MCANARTLHVSCRRLVSKEFVSVENSIQARISMTLRHCEVFRQVIQPWARLAGRRGGQRTGKDESVPDSWSRGQDYH